MIGYYLHWAIPFVITTFRQHGQLTTQPLPVPVTPDELPRSVRETFEYIALRLGEQGFWHSAVHAVTMNGTPAAAHLLHLVNPASGDHAIAYRLGEHAWITLVRVHAGGTHVVTSNSKQPGVFDPHPLVSTVRSAATEEPAELYALHRAHAEQKARGGTLGAVVAAAADAGFVGAWERLTMDRQVEMGVYARAGDGYRTTLRGAVLLTRRSLPHAREERDRRDAQAAAALRPRAVTA